MDTEAFLGHIQGQAWYRDQIAHIEELPAREAHYANPEAVLPAALSERLRSLGLLPLYDHQARAIDSLARGANVIVATPAASGKSMCYHVPALAAVLASRQSRALYVYPTKALAQDQLRKLAELADGLPEEVHYAVYDGDTPGGERAGVRRNAHVVLTNPDMLHLGILPNRQVWKQFFSRLRYVVFDEAHAYRGVFGSHVANVIRRLRRVCGMYGNSPQFVLCSATIANPGEHAEALTGLPFEVIDADGSPFSGKSFVFWNPPLVGEGKTARGSPNTEATLAFSELLKREVRTIAFCRSRKVTELVYMYVRDRLREEGPGLAERLMPYRAGYLPEDRRRIERGLFNGDLLGVSATTALELGIDVGDIDATLLTGYPGTIASAWQQAGRSGRRSERSLSIMIGTDNPLDQYLMRHPEAFFGRSQEHARISPSNPYILKPHLLCAAFEGPLTHEDEALFGKATWPLALEMEHEGDLHERRGRWFPAAHLRYPAEAVNIRSTTASSVEVVEEHSGRLLETVDSAMVFSQLHPGAVYLHQGESFLVTRLELGTRTAWVVPHGEPYYTVPRDSTNIAVLNLASRKEVHGTGVYLGEVDVSNTVVGFKRKRQFTEQVLDDESLDLPTRSFVTVALWFDIPEAAMSDIDSLDLDLAGALHAAEHAAIGMLPLFAMCDRADIGGVSTARHQDTGKPQVFIYDGHPGGIGIAEHGYEAISDLWEATLKTIRECGCSEGCPSCIQSPKCGNNNDPLDKKAAALLLQRLLAE